jgi:S1-C subfamily serine protease
VNLDAKHSYVNVLFEFQPGDRVELKVVRGNEVLQMQVTLGEAELNYAGILKI